VHDGNQHGIPAQGGLEIPGSTQPWRSTSRMLTSKPS
jgi:hypothetical protein